MDPFRLLSSLTRTQPLDDARIAVLGDGPLARSLTEHFPRAAVHLLAKQDRSLERIHVGLAALGPFDVILDTLDPGTEVRFRRLLFHVQRDRGAYVIAATETNADAFEYQIQDWLRPLQDRRDNGAAPPRVGDDREPKERDLDALAWSLRRVECGDEFVLVRHRAHTAATLRDRQASRLLRARGKGCDVLAERPGRTFAARGQVSTSSQDSWNLLDREITAPPLAVRSWADVDCYPGQIATDGNLLLPASLNRGTRGRLAHSSLARWSHHFVAHPGTAGPIDRLEGSWFYLDNILRGHFGHALSEQLAVTWGWKHALEHDPSTRALMFKAPGAAVAEWELQLLGAAGIPRERIHVAAHPVRVRALVTATAMLSRPDYIHPDAVETYARVGQSLANQACPRTRPDRVFLSRRAGRRTCLNLGEVEDFHRDLGFAIVYPEALPLPDQVRLVREATLVSGFAGSGMFHIALSGRPKHVVAISSSAYHAHNEQLFSALLGHRLDLVMCAPDVPRGAGFSRESFHSSFTLDWRRDGHFLREALGVKLS